MFHKNIVSNKLEFILEASLTLRVLMITLMSHSRKRPTLEEVQAHRWLNPADYMLKKRERAHFTTNRIQVSCK